MKIHKYEKKPVQVEAIRVTRRLVDYLRSNQLQGAFQRFFTFDGSIRAVSTTSRAVIYIQTLEGDMEAKIGDYIIKGIAGELYPCDPKIFQKIYKRVEVPRDDHI